MQLPGHARNACSEDGFFFHLNETGALGSFPIQLSVDYWLPAVDASTESNWRSCLLGTASRTFTAPAFRQILDGRLVTDGLRVQGHEIEELRWNVVPHGQAETLCRL